MTNLKFNGWGDENCESPKKTDNYLCLVKRLGVFEYSYEILKYYKEDNMWEVSFNVEHILWCDILQTLPNPFS